MCSFNAVDEEVIVQLISMHELNSRDFAYSLDKFAYQLSSGRIYALDEEIMEKK